MWWVLPLIPLGDRGKHVSDFEASSVYKVDSKSGRATQRNLVSLPPPQREQSRFIKVFEAIKNVTESCLTIGEAWSQHLGITFLIADYTQKTQSLALCKANTSPICDGSVVAVFNDLSLEPLYERPH